MQWVTTTEDCRVEARDQRKAVEEYKKAKKQFERILAKDTKTNPKSFYAYVRSKVKDSVGPLGLDRQQWKVGVGE